jgi:hypothetical protein
MHERIPAGLGIAYQSDDTRVSFCRHPALPRPEAGGKQVRADAEQLRDPLDGAGGIQHDRPGSGIRQAFGQVGQQERWPGWSRRVSEPRAAGTAR